MFHFYPFDKDSYWKFEIKAYLIIPTSTENSPNPMTGKIANMNDTIQIKCIQRFENIVDFVIAFHEQSPCTTD